MQSTDKQIESIINLRITTYEKEKAGKGAEIFFCTADQQIESIINLRMRTYEKEEAVKSANFFCTTQTNKLS